MTIHFLNCFTSSARIPAHWQTGMLCLLIETDQGLVLVDTGPGQEDYVQKSGIVRVFEVVTIVPMDPEETAIHQIVQLGYKPEEVRHIVLTHMHFDHCGGLPDFPQARVHVHRREHEAFTGRLRHWTEFAYVRRHIAHHPKFELYEEQGEKWFDFPAIRLPFEPEIWLIPLFGHSRGHCGVAVRTEMGWLLHVGDAAPVGLEDNTPDWLIKFVMGPHVTRLEEFDQAHPEVRMVTSHMALDFFENSTQR